MEGKWEIIGCDEEQLNQIAEFYELGKGKNYGRLFAAVSILSDAQEVNKFSQEQNRQFINRAKFLIIEVLKTMEEK